MLVRPFVISAFDDEAFDSVLTLIADWGCVLVPLMALALTFFVGFCD